MMALSVSSNFNSFWRGSIFNIIFRGEGLEEKTKIRLYLRALFVHCDAAPQKVNPGTGLAFSLNGTFDDFFNYFFLWLLSAQGQYILEKVRLYR